MVKRNRKYERGQSLVEMALSLPILILILSGLLDIGRVYYTYIALEEAAAEAAVYLSINPQCINATYGTACAAPNNAEWRTLNSASAQELDPTLLTVDTATSGLQTVGDIVTVELSYQFQFVMPVIQSLMSGNSVTLSVTATHIILVD